jgi:D-3-phosphoglycerate dehydrogenase
MLTGKMAATVALPAKELFVRTVGPAFRRVGLIATPARALASSVAWELNISVPSVDTTEFSGGVSSPRVSRTGVTALLDSDGLFGRAARMAAPLSGSRTFSADATADKSEDAEAIVLTKAQQYFGVKDISLPMGQVFTTGEKAKEWAVAVRKSIDLLSRSESTEIATRVGVLNLGTVQPTAAVTDAGVEEIVEGFKAHGVLGSPVIVKAEDGSLVIGDGNHRFVAMKNTITKGPFQFSFGEETKIEMRPFVVPPKSFQSLVDEGQFLPLDDGDDKGSIYVEDKKTGKIYVPNPDLLERKTESEKIHAVRDLMPDAIGRLNKKSLVPEDRFVTIFDYDTIPGSDLPAKSFTVVADYPRIFVSGGLDSLMPNSLDVTRLQSMDAYVVDQDVLADSGLTIGGRGFEEGVVVFAESLEEAVETIVSVVKELPSNIVGTTEAFAAAPASESESESSSSRPSSKSNRGLLQGRGKSSPVHTGTRAFSVSKRSMAGMVEVKPRLTAYGKVPVVSVFDKVPEAELREFERQGFNVERLSKGQKVSPDTKIVLVRSSELTDDMMSDVKDPHLLTIVRLGSGTSNIKVTKGAITNTPGANGQSVAELGFGLLTSLARNISGARSELLETVRANKLTPGPEGDKALKEAYEATKSARRGTELSGKRLFVVGMGGVGSQVIRLAQQGYDMDVTAVMRSNLSMKDMESKVASLEGVVSDVSSINAVPLDALGTEMKPGDSLMICAQVTIDAGDLPDGINIVNLARQSSLVLSSKEEKPEQRFATDEPTVGILDDERLKVATNHLGASTGDAERRAASWGRQKALSLFEGLVPKGVEFRGVSEEEFVERTLAEREAEVGPVTIPSVKKPLDFSTDAIAQRMIAALGGSAFPVPAGPVRGVLGAEEVLQKSAHLAFVSHRSAEVMDLQQSVVDLGSDFLELDDGQVFIPNGVSASHQYVASVSALAENRDEPVQVVITGQWSQKAFNSIKRVFPNAVAVPYAELDALNPEHPVHFTLGETIAGCISEPPVHCPKLVVDASTGLGATEFPTHAAYVYGGNQKVWGLPEEAWVVARPELISNADADFLPEAMTFKSQLNLGRTFSPLALALQHHTLSTYSKEHGSYTSWTLANRMIGEAVIGAFDSTLYFKPVFPPRALEGPKQWASPINVVAELSPDATVPFSVVKAAFAKALPGSSQHKTGGKRELRITTMNTTQEQGEAIAESIRVADKAFTEHADAVRLGDIVLEDLDGLKE